MENAPGPEGHADPKEPPLDREDADRGVPDPATRGPEGPELHDQVGHPGPDGSPAGDTGVATEVVGAPPAGPESGQPLTGRLGGRPQPRGAVGIHGAAIPPHIGGPRAARGG